jgi:hypothetical protein
MTPSSSVTEEGVEYGDHGSNETGSAAYDTGSSGRWCLSRCEGHNAP